MPAPAGRLDAIVAGAPAAVDAAAAGAATSPANDLPEPTAAMKEAGNYKKGHARIAGLDISVENEAGSRRRPEWPTMKAHYGYVRRTEGADGDHVDVFVRPGTPADYDGPVFVVDQVKPDGSFDEHKAMIGWQKQGGAVASYRASYTRGWKVGPVTEVPMAEFKRWLAEGDTKRPFAGRTGQRAQDGASAQRERRRAQYARERPFRAFLAQHGVHPAERADTGADAGRKGNPLVPHHGPIFRQGGRRLDELARLAAEAGFLPERAIEEGGGVEALVDLMRREWAGENVRTISGIEEVAAAEASRRMEAGLEAEATALGLDTSGMSAAQIEDYLSAHREEMAQARANQLASEVAAEIEATIEALGLETGVDEQARVTLAAQLDEAAVERAAKEALDDVDFLRRIEDILREHESSDDQAAEAPRGGPHGAEVASRASGPQAHVQAGRERSATAEADQGFLTGQTPGEARAQAAARERADRERRQRAAAPEPEGFTLTGSDRPVDEARARGQKELEATPASQGRAESAARRSRPRDAIMFKQPVVGPSGARLTGYRWQWTLEESVDTRGEDRVRRISDWTKAEASSETGRDIVHQFAVQMSDGSDRLVSAESAVALLGFGDAPGKARFKSVSSAAKTLARLRMAQAEAAQAKAEFDSSHQAVEALALPEMPTEPANGGWWRLGDHKVRQVEAGPLREERRRSLIEGWRANRMRERGWQPWDGDRLVNTLQELDRRIGRAQKRLDELTASAAQGQTSGMASEPEPGVRFTLRQRRGGRNEAQLEIPLASPEGPDRAGTGQAAAARHLDATAALRVEPEPDATGTYRVRTELRAERTRDIPAGAVTTPAQAARALQHLGQYAVEHFDALVTDAAGRPLAIVGSFKGSLTQTPVYASTVIQEVVRIPDAANLWFSHNHPSGAAELSNADRMLYGQLRDLLRGTGIEPRGILAQTNPGAWVHSDGERGTVASKLAATASVPIMERVIVHDDQARPTVSGPATARDLARETIEAGQRGPFAMLLDTRNGLVGVYPLTLADAAPLRPSGRVRRLWTAVSESNAAAVILVDPRATVPEGALRNINAALEAIDTRALDVMRGEDLASWAEKGLDVADKAFFSREPRTDGMDVAAVRQVVAAVRKAWANGPEVEVVADINDPAVPQAVRDADAEQRASGGQGESKGVFHAGRMFLFARALSTEDDVVRVLMHEALGHYGLQGAFGEALNGVLDKVVDLRRAEVAAKMREYGLANTPQNRRLAAEEVLATLAQAQPQLPIVRGVIAAIRSWLRRIMPNLRLTNDEIIRDILIPAREFVRRGAATQFRETERAYGGREGYDRAKAAGRTKLGYQQWIEARTARFIERFGDWQIVIAPSRLASTFSEARTALGDALGRDLTNFSTGLVARVSRNSLDKMLNDKAVGKSESPALHALAVANIDALFENALRGWSKPDSGGDPNITAVHRFFAPLNVNGRARLAKITVRELAGPTPNRVYSVESVEFNEKSPAAQWVAASADADGIDLTSTRSARDVESLARRVQEFKPVDLTAAVDPTTGEPLASAIDAADQGVRFSREPQGKTVGEIVQDAARPKRLALGGNMGQRASEVLRSLTVQDVARRLGNRLADLRGVALQTLGRRQLTEVYQGLLPAIAEYNAIAQQMDAEKNDSAAAADELARRWGRLSDERALADLMHDATLAGVDPAKDDVASRTHPDWAPLRRRWLALSEDARGVYVAARDMYAAHYAAVKREVAARIDRAMAGHPRRREMLERMEANLFGDVQGVYFPLARFGDYVIVAKSASGEVAAVSRAETLNEAETLRMRMMRALPASKGYTVGKVLKSREFNAARDAVGRGFLQELYGVLDAHGAAGAELQDAINQLYLSSLPDLSWAKHGMHRKGTPGFSQDARRAFAQNLFHGARYLAKLRHSDRLTDALTAMQEHVDEHAEDPAFDSIAGQQVVDEMVKRHEIFLNPKVHPLATLATSAGFVFYLGLSPASALVNLSQTPLVAYPVLGAKWGFRRAAAHLMAASRETMAAGNDLSSRLQGEELAAFKQAVADGTIDVTFAHDLGGIAQGEDAKVLWRMRPVMRAAAFMFHHAERFNRQVTFLAAYRMARQAGAPEALAYRQAVEATYASHFDYSACVDEATEILTTAGWKKRTELRVGDVAIATDAAGRAVESKVLAINVFEGEHEVIEFSSANRFSMVLTPNHDCVVQCYNSRDRKWQAPRKVRAAALRKSHFIVRAPLAPLERDAGRLGEDFAALLGWIAAEGWYAKYRGCREAHDVRIGQSLTHNPEYVAEIRALLNRLGGEFKEYVQPRERDELVTFVLRRSLGRRVQEALPDKVLTGELLKLMSVAEMRAFIMAFLKGDGTKYEGGKAWAVGQKDGANLDLLQAMATMCGMRATLSPPNGNGIGALYVVPDDTGCRSHVRPLRQNRRTEPLVWCPTTEHGTWVARRNGAVFVTGNSNRPRVMQGNFARVVLLFKQFAQNMIYTLSRAAYLSWRGKGEEKAEARKALAALLTMHGLAAGALGLPIVGPLLTAASMLGSSDDEPWDAEVALRNYLAEAFGPRAGAALAHGLSRLTPWDISGRVGLDDLLFPDVREGLEGEEWAFAAAASAAGPALNMALIGPAKGLQLIGEGHWMRGLEAMLPAVLRSGVKSLRYATEGVMTRDGKTILDDVGVAEWLGQAAGFSPSRAREASEGREAVYNLDRRINARRATLMREFGEAIMKRDHDATGRYLEQVRAFNAAHPDRPITTEAISQSIRMRKMRAAEAERGVYLPRRRRGLLEEGAFADVE